MRHVLSIGLASVLALTPLGLIGAENARWSGSAEDYERAKRVLELGRGTVFKTAVKPRWFAGNTHFWYVNELAGGKREFWLVDAAKGARQPAFDAERLAAGLQKAGVKNANAERLPILGMEFRAETRLQLNVGGKYFECDLTTHEVKETNAATLAAGSELARLRRMRASRAGGEETSVLFINESKQEVRLFWLDLENQRQGYGSVKAGEQHLQHTFAGHVWLAADAEGRTLGVYEASEVPSAARLSDEGERGNAQAVRETSDAPRERGLSPDGKWNAFIKDENVWLKDAANGESVALSSDGRPGDGYGALFWSPDSTRLAAIKTRAADDRKIQIVESSPKNQLQPKVLTANYPKPGDRVAVEKPHLFDAVSRKEIPVSGALFENPWDLSRYHWEQDSKRFTFLFNQRGHQALRVCAIDAATGRVSAIINEESKTFIDYRKQFYHSEEATREIVWSSERDGWNHLYLYDAATGTVKNQVTRGEWVVRGVERVDSVQRQIYFQAGGVYPGQDPYHIHYCRVNFDGSGLVKLTEGDGTHTIQYSPDGRYFVDTYSRVDLPPVTELRRSADGTLVCELERADASALFAKKWVAPERFTAKGRDGKTDIYGVILRPTDFDAQRKYPVLEHIYAGPHGSFVPKTWSANHGVMSALAELGFIVVQIDGMGTNHRSKAFHDVCWKNLADGGFPDRISWMKAAAEKYPYMDLSRVGIYGGSAGGQNALGAMLFHPDFYKAAAADCGCHDNRMDKIWWNEQWMGWPVGKHYDEQSNVTNAHRLKGKLLLTVGELDTNVDPASTMQVVNALVKADKDFEYVVIPGGGHGSGETPYARRRRMDFFVRSLMGVEPRH